MTPKSLEGQIFWTVKIGYDALRSVLCFINSWKGPQREVASARMLCWVTSKHESRHATLGCTLRPGTVAALDCSDTLSDRALKKAGTFEYEIPVLSQRGSASTQICRQGLLKSGEAWNLAVVAWHGMARHVIIFHRTRYICSSDRLQHFKRGNHLNIWYRLSGVRVSVRVFRGAAFPESIHETENLHLHRRNLISVLIISFSGRFDREFAISFARTGSPFLHTQTTRT